MGKQKNNYYALILRGKEPVILTSWEECKKKKDDAVREEREKGKVGAVRPLYHGFPTKEEAEDFINGKWRGNPVSEEARTWLEAYKAKAVQLELETELEAKLDISAFSDGAVAYVDGSYNKEKKCYGSGVVFIYDGEIKKLYGGGQDRELEKLGSAAGELLACMEAIKYAETLGVTKLTIIYDCDLILWTYYGGGKELLPQAAGQYMYDTREKMELTVEAITDRAFMRKEDRDPGHVLAENLAWKGAGFADRN